MPSGAVTRKGLTTPLTRRVASGCYLCAGAVCVLLLSSPTGWITLVSLLREILTIAVLHHPLLFGEIPTQIQAIMNVDYMTLHHYLGLGEGIGK